MKLASSEILSHFYAITRASLYREFHASAHALKGKSRPKGEKYPKSMHTPARKRLVSSLKPKENIGTYEIAPRNHTKQRQASIHGGGSPAAETSLGSQQKFEREEAPHTGRLTDEQLRLIRMKHRRESDFGRRGIAVRRPRIRTEYIGRGLLGRGGNDVSNGLGPRQTPSPPIVTTWSEGFHTPEFEPDEAFHRAFTSPPLMDGFLRSIHDVLGPKARPSPIQSLALKHLFTPLPSNRPSGTAGHKTSESTTSSSPSVLPSVWREHLLAAETGSGKSIAYLLPMLQHLKRTELDPTHAQALLAPDHPLPLYPRGLILAPTHELVRQLSVSAKALLHHTRLRVLCASRANTPSSAQGRSTARQLKRELDETGLDLTVAGVGLHGKRPVDVLVGTTTKVLEMVRGLGWDKAARIDEQWDEIRKKRARNWVPGPPEMGLSHVEWVVVDEADVLFDRDFEMSTRLLLADIARARGYLHPSFAELDAAFPKHVTPASEPIPYPFHLTFVSATIPTSLANYLSVAHPKMARLASPGLHRLPSTLTTEYFDWTSGNKNADIEKRIRRVWADDVQSSSGSRSKVLVFCNKTSRVEDLGLYLREKGIPNVALTSHGMARARGSNRHLDGFLRHTEDLPNLAVSKSEAVATPRAEGRSALSAASDPHVLIATSLLSRGLDFSPQIRHVFVTDPPRNMIDFLHRAGRAGRAGNAGRVVVFGKAKGRGAGEAREVQRRVRAVAR